MRLWLLVLSFIFIACRDTAKVDLIIFNATIYTVDSTFSKAEAIAVRDGKIEDIGSSQEITGKYYADTKVNAEGKFIYPGFIDAHAHFYRYGLGLSTANLVETSSWDDITSKLETFASDNTEGWLIGRGWDQNKWEEKEFPSKEKLDQLFPNRPVLLTRVDGHAAIANQKALDEAGIRAGMRVTGGEIEVKNGKLTGILVDNAIRLVSSKIPAPTITQVKKSLDAAQKNCFAVGLTTVDDCGINYKEMLLMDSFQKSGELKMRIYAMLSDAKENYDFLFDKGKIKTDLMHVRSFKVYADGALGSRGACLLEPYNDRSNWKGFLLSDASHFDSVANILNAKDFQMCTHAIGDSGNRVILNIYAKYLQGTNDKRWRIEHAQVVNENDFAIFGTYNIIPSVQPTHATSDMYWAGDRLGKEREKGAYAFRWLTEQNGWVPLGTDFPVEDISPFKTFLASVFRQDAKGYPATGYQMENALSREQAIRGMTIWAAKSNFEEQEKGSLEKGKFADFIILDRDLMTIKAEEVLSTTVLATYLGGERVYGK
ncbi:MAG: amidohydrolase [Bacteroidota bacterium]|jgi:predicted amidohydrolase YtcJ|nr:amidohydrolase [Bacteroidota bacterium]